MVQVYFSHVFTISETDLDSASEQLRISTQWGFRKTKHDNIMILKVKFLMSCDEPSASRIPSTPRLHKAQNGSNPVGTNTMNQKMPHQFLYVFVWHTFPSIKCIPSCRTFQGLGDGFGVQKFPLTNSHQTMKSAHGSPAEGDSKQKMVINVPRRYWVVICF